MNVRTRSLGTVLALLSSVAAVSCGGHAEPKAALAPPVDEGDAERREAEAAKHPEADVAERIVDAMGRGDFTAALEGFATTARATHDEASLREAWDSIAAGAGGFRGIDRIETVRVPGFTAVKVRCNGKDAAFEVRVTFGSGESASPRATALAVTHAYDPPAYADASRFGDEGAAIGNGGRSLPASVTTPIGEGPFPAVVLLPASGALDHDGTMGGTKVLRDIAWGLASRGVVTLRFDKRDPRAEGARGAKGAPPKGDAVDDALAALAALRKHPKVDKKRLYLVGHDEGGRFAPRIAEKAPPIAGIALLAASTKRLPPDYWPAARTYDPVKSLRKLKVPLLIVHADRDFETTDKDLARWRKSLAGRKACEFTICEGCNHHLVLGQGPSAPEEYARPGHVARALVEQLAGFVR